MDSSTVAITISILALLLSVYQFYYYRLRSSELKMFVGSKLFISGHPKKLSFVVPITFYNRGANIGKIGLITLTIKSQDDYYMIKWSNFKKLNSESTYWIQKNIAHILPIQGYSSVTEMIEFSWDTFPFDGLNLDKMEFIFTFWTDIHKKSYSETFRFFPTNPEKNKLEELISKVENGTITTSNVFYFDLESNLKPNQVLTAHEFRKIIS